MTQEFIGLQKIKKNQKYFVKLVDKPIFLCYYIYVIKNKRNYKDYGKIKNYSHFNTK
jgi:hypothetical protein